MNMDAKTKKSCPYCNQLYQLKSLTANKHGNIPLFLSCGHSMCEYCIRNIVKFAEPICCKVCRKDTEISADDLSLMIENKLSLYQLFPVNCFTLGELTFEKIQDQEKNDENQDKNFYIDVKSILDNTIKTEGMCMECHSPTSKMCQQCGIIVCNNCFTKSHKNFIIFKNHILQNIEAIQDEVFCSTHIGKPLDYYCKNCMKAVCMDCLMVGGEKSCKNHNVVSSQDVNQELMTEIQKLVPGVNEKLKRFTKVAVDLGNIMTNLNNDPNTIILKLCNEVEQSYSTLLARLQYLKQDIIHKLEEIRSKEFKSLIESKSQIVESIKKTKETVDKINSLQDKKLGQVNLSGILEDAKKIISEPWYLKCDSLKDSLGIKTNTDLIDCLQDFVYLEEPKELSTYELLTTEQLIEKEMEVPPPPLQIVYPPELVKDVRQVKKKVIKDTENKPDATNTLIRSAPRYRSKSGSCSSLNSIASDSSQNDSYCNSQKKSKNYINSNEPQSAAHVQPYQMKPLLPGDQDIVYITHIVDPHNFFVQRACHQSLVEELLKEFRKASSMPRPAVTHITEGKIYLVFIKADNLWQRCRVLSVDRTDPNKLNIRVFCFDFGSIDTVTIDKLRLITSFRLKNPPPLAINCSLDSVQPIAGTWTSDDALLIQNIIDKSVNPHSSAVQIIQNSKQAVITAKEVTGGPMGARVSCELATFDHGVSVAHALAFHGRAKLKHNAQYPKLLGIKDKQKIFATNNTFQPNSKEEVVITHVVSPDKFFVRKAHLQNVYEKLCNDLNQEYNLNGNTEMIYLPVKNMVCAVKVESGGWERARVDDLPGGARVHVQLLDTGRSALVHWTALRRLQDKRCTLRALATECHLAGVTPLNQKWSPGSVLVLRELEGCTLTAHVDSSRSIGSVGVTLYDDRDPDDVVCINKLMIQRKYAVSLGIFMFNVESEMEDLVITNKSPLQESKPVVKREKKLQILKPNTPFIDDTENEKDLKAKNKGPYTLEVNILNYQSPSQFYVALTSQQKVFNELYEKIQTYFTKKQTQPQENWNVGDRCCAICKQSQTWRRAVVLEVTGETAKVFYSDFAVVELVDVSSLREIPADLKAYGDAAIECHVTGVIPAVGTEWPSLTKEFLKELIDAYPRVFITKNGNYKGKSLPVELWVYHTTQGGALEPNVSEWRCLNKRIIEQGLGVPDKTQELSTNTSEQSKEETISFLNLTGSLEDWLQIEPMPLKPLAAELDRTSNTDSSTPTECDTSKKEDNAQDSDTIFISDWLPAGRLPREEFIGVPTNVDHDGVIYLHNIEQEDTLDLIRKALDVRFKHPDPKAKFVKWSVGEPCVALYYLDNKFYRGRVLEVNKTASTCLIHYIDYGNEEVCPFANIRKSIALHQIPIQARKCVLGRIKPAGKQWDRQTLDYIHKSIVEKHCHIEVIGEPMKDVEIINLRYDKLCINEHLVDFEMAIFTDGSKAKVQKFVPSSRNKTLNVSLDGTTDSGPDYIIEHDDDDETPSESPVIFDMDQFRNKDWNEILDEESKSLDGRFVSYPQNILTEFFCVINVINNLEKLELCVVNDDTTKELYETIFEEIQNEDNLLPLDGIFENKACVALFSEDNKWYRAVILQYSEAEGQVKVKYVDYGNIGIVTIANVREIDSEYAKLPPATITATLHGVKINPDIPKETIFDCYSKMFLDQGPFKAIVINNESLPEVLLQDENGKLVYEDFFGNIFMKSD